MSSAVPSPHPHPHTLYLLIYRPQPTQRAHFALWTPDAENEQTGTKIHVVGNPMMGFVLEVKRKYNPREDASLSKPEFVAIGSIYDEHGHGAEGGGDDDAVGQGEGEAEGEGEGDGVSRGMLERVATQITPPRASGNFMAPVNDTTNRRCREWTMDFIKRLVALGYLDQEAVEIVRARRDAPGFGIELRPVATD